MKKIAIRFGDNDFWSTMRGLLAHIHDAIKYGITFPTDKDKLAFIINQLMPICYITHQNMFEYNSLQNETGQSVSSCKYFLDTSKYLKIESENILINEEVDEFVKNTDWDNSETFILDTTLFNNHIYSI